MVTGMVAYNFIDDKVGYKRYEQAYDGRYERTAG